MTSQREPRSIAFVDVETTGLDPRRHHVWEIAVIVRRHDGNPDAQHLWQVRLTEEQVNAADPKALIVNRFTDRYAPGSFAARSMHPGRSPRGLRLIDLRMELHVALERATLVGSNPAFDAAFLATLLPDRPWHYRTVDIATLAAGYLIGSGRGDEVTVPYSSRDLSAAVGVVPPPDGEAHAALPDAAWAMAVYDAVTSAPHTR